MKDESGELLTNLRIAKRRYREAQQAINNHRQKFKPLEEAVEQASADLTWAQVAITKYTD